MREFVLSPRCEVGLLLPFSSRCSRGNAPLSPTSSAQAIKARVLASRLKLSDKSKRSKSSATGSQSALTKGFPSFQGSIPWLQPLFGFCNLLFFFLSGQRWCFLLLTQSATLLPAALLPPPGTICTIPRRQARTPAWAHRSLRYGHMWCYLQDQLLDTLCISCPVWRIRTLC